MTGTKSKEEKRKHFEKAIQKQTKVCMMEVSFHWHILFIFCTFLSLFFLYIVWETVFKVAKKTNKKQEKKYEKIRNFFPMSEMGRKKFKSKFTFWKILFIIYLVAQRAQNWTRRKVYSFFSCFLRYMFDIFQN